MKSIIALGLAIASLIGAAIGDATSKPVDCREITDISIVGHLNVYEQCRGGFTGMTLEPRYLRRAGY